jgi:hypothetical protein
MVLATVKKPPPARSYPNINALHGIRYHFDSTDVVDPSGIVKAASGLIKDKPIVIGTIPGKAFIQGFTWHVAKAAAVAVTLDVGTKANPTKWLAAGLLNAIARNDALPATYGYVGDVDTPVYATIRGVTAAGVEDDLKAAIFSFLIYYYPQIGD